MGLTPQKGGAWEGEGVERKERMIGANKKATAHSRLSDGSNKD